MTEEGTVITFDEDGNLCAHMSDLIERMAFHEDARDMSVQRVSNVAWEGMDIGWVARWPNGEIITSGFNRSVVLREEAAFMDQLSIEDVKAHVPIL